MFSPENLANILRPAVDGESDDVNGARCVMCTLGIGTLANYADFRNVSIDQILNNLCDRLPDSLKKLEESCRFMVDIFGEALTYYVNEGRTADDICALLGVCTNLSCVLFPASVGIAPPKTDNMILQRLNSRLESKVNHPQWEWPWQWLLDDLEKAMTNHYPVFDIDSDYFSDVGTLRGHHWRGKDCSDMDSRIYPGRSEHSGLEEVDYNCNGIFGLTSEKRSWKEELCDGTQQMGVGVVGDSCGARFRINPAYLNVSLIDSTTYSDLLTFIEDEGDWPRSSVITGYQNITGDQDDGYYPIRSIYTRLRELNRCNHRDYQNLAVNGASSKVGYDLVKTLRRTKDDFPMLFFHEFIGNDVCYHEQHKYTPVDRYINGTITALDALDEVLPPGSHVVAMGVTNGSKNYEALKDHIHPTGVSYARFWGWLQCLNVNPCSSWLTDDPDLRRESEFHALQLSKALGQIVSSYKWKNFDVMFYDTNIRFSHLFDSLDKQGVETWKLFELVDGFHPSQYLQTLIMDDVWELIQKDHPTWIPPENPNNARIESLFNDQGGYY